MPSAGEQRRLPSVPSVPSVPSSFIPPHGGYESLHSYYRDFLRTRGLRLWEKDSKEALFVRKLGATPDASYEAACAKP